MKGFRLQSQGILFVIAILGLLGCSERDVPTDAAQNKKSATAPEEIATSGQEQIPIIAGAENVKSQAEAGAGVTRESTSGTRAEPGTGSALNTKSVGPKQHIIKGVVTQWSPMVLFVRPGDQVVFRGMIGHDTQTIDGMIPDGATAWKSKLGEEGFSVTLDVPGAYVHKCNPHVSLGMIGAIIVGDLPPVNLQQIEDHPQNKSMIGRAIRKLKAALAVHGAD